ncbi:MAG: carbon starvation protein A [Verrucomicrobiae bacterium]|nr:carbon starvation protein A [Verrucomicrobiae bacterium]
MLKLVLWLGVAGLGAVSLATVAFHRGEPLNSAHLVIAAVCTYAIGYRFYSKWIVARVLTLNDRRATPAEVREDGRDFVKTHRWIVFGHHFAAISGPGPLVGPVLAAQFGYLPGALWILIGVVLGGAVQDLVILVASMRREGRSLGQMVRDELNPLAGTLAMVAILVIMIILLAVLALVVVNALAESPWGVFTVAATIPIALAMGGYLRWVRAGRTLEASVAGVVLLLAAVWGGQWVHSHAGAAVWFTLPAPRLAWMLIAYGLAASVLPVWLLLAPRDYLSTFMKLGTILALAGGVLLVLPVLQMPPVTSFVDGSGPVVPGKLFPFCFITIACGAISGFHALIASGITPKIIARESHARSVGYGAMCLESLVAIMALIAACTLEPGVYLAMNIRGAGPDAAAIAADTVARVQATGFTVDPETMDALATAVGEHSLYGRTGGAATLAVGMAAIFSRLTQGRWLDLWYHFAIMFEALFILTTLDAGTRVGRYLLQDFLGHLWTPLGNTRSVPANVLASALIVSGWGFVLLAGAKNPDGGTKALWPIFGIANQLLAAIALCLATTVLLKTGLRRSPRAPVLALVTLVPLLWLLTVTFTAGWQKLFHPSPRIGFLAALAAAEAQRPMLETALADARSGGDSAAVARAAAALATNRLMRGNHRFDAGITAVFLTMASALVLVSVWEWIRLLRGSRPADLTETEPVWLPDPFGCERGAGAALGTAALALGLLREWSGEAAVQRAHARIQERPSAASGEVVLVDVPEVRTAVERARRVRAYRIAAGEDREETPRCC